MAILPDVDPITLPFIGGVGTEVTSETLLIGEVEAGGVGGCIVVEVDVVPLVVDGVVLCVCVKLW